MPAWKPSSRLVAEVHMRACVFICHGKLYEEKARRWVALIVVESSVTFSLRKIQTGNCKHSPSVKVKRKGSIARSRVPGEILLLSPLWAPLIFYEARGTDMESNQMWWWLQVKPRRATFWELESTLGHSHTPWEIRAHFPLISAPFHSCNTHSSQIHLETASPGTLSRLQLGLLPFSVLWALTLWSMVLLLHWNT